MGTQAEIFFDCDIVGELKIETEVLYDASGDYYDNPAPPGMGFKMEGRNHG